MGCKESIDKIWKWMSAREEKQCEWKKKKRQGIRNEIQHLRKKNHEREQESEKVKRENERESELSGNTTVTTGEERRYGEGSD